MNIHATEESWLRELLNLIHRDGGQHTESLGVMRSCYDARERILETRKELADTKELLQRYRSDTGWSLE